MQPFRRAGTTEQALQAAVSAVPEHAKVKFCARLTQIEDDGSRYRNLEKSLGEGATLALGIELGESYWKKFLPKSGIAGFIRRARETRLAELAIRFAPLRKEIVRYYLNEHQSRPRARAWDATTVQDSIQSADASYRETSTGLAQETNETNDDELWAELGVEIPATPV
ncbi:hypothetical protein KVT40_001771 [Elsinoe batatas]|uniref:Uncharacterized protein n=1 Tax=Elsinoe batatas TaxID=2601811 RepID=A0A8K0PJ42_9PEZI|nr:hypothetical protein KVT40_001771 [Elsinoe batatas]